MTLDFFNLRIDENLFLQAVKNLKF